MFKNILCKWCSGLRAGAPVQAAEISFRSWERTPGQPHPPLTHTGKKEEKHFSFAWLSPTQVRGKRTRKTRNHGNACYAYFNFPSPTPHQKNLPAFYDFSTFVSIKIYRNWKVLFPWSFPAPKGFANELKWIFCAAGFWFWSRFVLRLLTTQRFNKTLQQFTPDKLQWFQPPPPTPETTTTTRVQPRPDTLPIF